jgi:hypothetical protein
VFRSRGLAREGVDRFLFAEGRGVGLRETQLIFNPATHRSKINVDGGGDRRAVRASVGVEIVAEEVMKNPGANKTVLINAVRPRISSSNQNAAADAISEAIRQCKIHVVDGGATASCTTPGLALSRRRRCAPLKTWPHTTIR